MPTQGPVVLIGCGPIVADRTGNERHFLDLFFEVELVPRITTDRGSKWDEVQMILAPFHT